MNEDVKVIGEVKDKVLDLLHQANQAKDFSMGDVDFLYKATKTVKNSCEIEEMMDGGYSHTGDWEMEGRGTYGRGSSYANRRRDSMGRYSREDGYSSRRDSRCRYSRDGGTEAMMEHLRQAMAAATDDRERDAIRRMMENLEG